MPLLFPIVSRSILLRLTFIPSLPSLGSILFNTKENLERNGITNADVYWTDFMETDLHADIIIANLPRETGAFCMPKMKQSLNEGGTIITSWYNVMPTDELLEGWDTVSLFMGENYDIYILRRTQ